MTDSTLTLAVVQMAMTSEVDRNVAHAEELVRDAAGRGARLILLPELFENLYWCQVQREGFSPARIPSPGTRSCRGSSGSRASWASCCRSASSSEPARRTTTAWR
jgi:predicted amidohydrolase